MSVEEVFYIPRDTKIFIIYDRSSFDDMFIRDKTIHSFEYYGFNNISLQPLLDVDVINNSQEELGFPSLNTPMSRFTTTEIQQWYTFTNVLRKARALQKHFLVVFSGTSIGSDIPREVFDHPFYGIRKGIYSFSSSEADRQVKRIINHPQINETVKTHLLNLHKYILPK